MGRPVLVIGATAAWLAACTLVVDTGDLTGGPTRVGGIGEDGGIDAPSAAETSTTAVKGDAYRTTVLADGPLAYWRLGEASGTIAHDEVPGAPTGTYDGVTLGAPGIFGPGGDTAITTGNGSHVELPDAFDFPGNAPYTLEAWFIALVYDQDNRNLINKEAVANEGWRMDVQAGKGVRCSRCASGSCNVVYSNVAISIGTLYHAACVYDGSRMRIAIDGVTVHDEAFATAIVDTSEPLRIGWGPDPGYGQFSGTIDEVAIYGKALTEAQLATHHAARLQ